MDKLGVWDADFIPFYILSKKDDKGRTLDLEEYYKSCDDIIQNINESVGCDSFIGFISRGKCFRYDIYPEYKANRKYYELPKYLNEIKEYLENTYNFISIRGYEADDLVYSTKANYKGQTIIISPDKDLLMLEGTHYNPKKNIFHYTSKEEAETYFWKSMMVGDSADNIKGIPGIGDKKAQVIIDNLQLFDQLRNTVLENYCLHFGEEKGIEEFYKNYKCLKIRSDVEISNIELLINKTVSTREQKTTTREPQQEES